MAKNVPVGYVDFVLNITRTGDLEPYAITFGGKVDAGPYTQENVAAVALQCATHLTGEMMVDDRLSGLTAYVANDGPPIIMTESMDAQGTVSTDPTTQNVAVIVTKLTGLGGRYNKGRMFWPSLAETGVNAVGVLAPVAQNNIEGAFSDWMTALLDPAEFCNLSDLVIFHDGSLVGLEPTVITQLRVEPVVGTQRRRLRK